MKDCSLLPSNSGEERVFVDFFFHTDAQYCIHDQVLHYPTL